MENLELIINIIAICLFGLMTFILGTSIAKGELRKKKEIKGKHGIYTFRPYTESDK